MGRYKPSRSHGKNGMLKLRKTKRRTLDLDQLWKDLHEKDENKKLVKTEINTGLPGLGQFYCVSCGRHFIDQHAFSEHNKTKDHKRQLRKLLKEKPYTGPDIKIDNGKPLRKPFNSYAASIEAAEASILKINNISNNNSDNNSEINSEINSNNIEVKMQDTNVNN
eukprot:TRINITY_DN512_c0_g2_i1.p1 TRINITY_DN512_c0_g2~~TRINITY_DN512_c0_g2_i1.p1  ORF type:complete len:165 (-),score=69.18 TRINITY_DN512_c0_g2_i1:97-591(-)